MTGTHIGSAHPVSMESDTKRKKRTNENPLNPSAPAPIPTVSPSESPRPKTDKKKSSKDNDGEEISVSEEKATNAMVALIRSLAEKSGRNADWGEKAVRESVSVTANEALKLNVVEIVAEDVPNLLQQLKGKTVTLPGKKTVTLAPSQDKIKRIQMTKIERFLLTINDPQIALLLMLLGSLGIYYELANPGAAVPAIVGGICLILGLYTMGSLPINYTALALIILSIILFIAEALSPTHGAFAVGGTLSFILGAVFLIPADIPFLRISPAFVITLGIIMGALSFIIVTLITKTMKSRVKTGSKGLIGQTAVVKTPLAPQGMVLFEGELWKAETSEDIITEGKKVIIDDIQGLLLKVHEKK
jgi:membrane-bound serine protease (ClpP class)